MEKLQLDLDDDPFPIYIPHNEIKTELFPRHIQEDKTKPSALLFHHKTSEQNNLDPYCSARTELCNQGNDQNSPQDGYVSSIFNEESVSCQSRDDLCVDVMQHGGEFPLLLKPNTVRTQDLLKPNTVRTQDEAEQKGKGAQDLFWASMLQAQLCVMELQDEIDKQEKPDDILGCFDLETRAAKSYLNPSTGDLEDRGEEEEDHGEEEEEDLVLEEGQEIDENFTSEEELEDESSFFVNPLFRDSHSSQPMGPSSPTTLHLRTNKNDLISSEEGKSQTEGVLYDQSLPVQDIKSSGMNAHLGHEITRAESLEILQIYEEEWEENNTLPDRVKADTWLSSGEQNSIQQNHFQPDNTSFSTLEGCDTESASGEAPCSEDQAVEEGLLFSASSFSLVSALLLEHESDLSLPPSKSDLTTPCAQEMLSEERIPLLCHDSEAHPVCQGCQGKEQTCGRSASGERTEMEGDELEMPRMDQECPEIVIEDMSDVPRDRDLETSGSEEVTYVETVPNGNSQDWEAARRLAMRLFQLDGFERSQVAPYLQKNNNFSTMVADQYLSFFDFTGKTLDLALRSLLQELVLTGETQERERVLLHFSKRFHSCNPQDFTSSDAVHTLTCAIMLLNSDLHGQNIGKSMSLQEFINNLDGMNDGANFSKDILKGLYNSIRNEKLEWAMKEEKLANSLISKPENLLSVRKKSNPFLDTIVLDPQAPTYKRGMLHRKVHADVDGKKTPWGKRGWKSFYTVLKGILMFFLKDEYRSDCQSPEEVISVHHALAERASEYTKRPYVFRLQTADWRVFLFQAQTAEEMNSWIVRINLVAAMFSSPPFPAAIGSQKRFVRPILPSTQSKLSLEEQLQSHETWMDTFTDDLTEHQRSLPDQKSKTRDWEDHQLREEYLRYEKSRYETYVKLLALRMQGGCEDLNIWESLLKEPDGACEESYGIKRSHSSPSLNPEGSTTLIKVKRNISERRTYRRIIPKRNKNLV